MYDTDIFHVKLSSLTRIIRRALHLEAVSSLYFFAIFFKSVTEDAEYLLLRMC